MSTIQQEMNERQKKLLELRQKAEERKKKQQSVSTGTEQKISIQQKNIDYEKLVDSLLQEDQEAKNNKQIQETNEQKPANKKEDVQKKLKITNFVGELNITNKILKYDQIVQTDLDQQEDINYDDVKVMEAKPQEDELPRHNQQQKVDKLKEQQLSKIEEETIFELSKEEQTTIIQSKTFQDFLNKMSKVVEKALDQRNDDILEQILARDDNNEKEELEELIHPLVNFQDNQNSANRVVTAIQWSPSIDELLLSAYNQNEQGNINDPLGVVILWSLNLRSRPEFTCFSQSPVTTACFTPYQNNLIIGGLYNGSVVIWDLKAKNFPVQRTTMSNGGHTYPVYCLDVVGTKNANNIISISNEGLLCVWDIRELNRPQRSINLKNRSNQEINVTCMAFPEGDHNKFYIGTEDGLVYQTQLHGNQQKNDNNIISTFEGHQAPITSVHISSSNQQNTPDYLSGMVISSSFDWSIKLWNPKNQQLVQSFENYEDYVMDVQWNPVNPTLFGSVDCDGNIDLWDIAEELDAPILHYKEDQKKQDGFNKMRWSKDGSKIATGSSNGELGVYGVDKKLLKSNQDKLEKLESLFIDKRDQLL